MRTLITIIAGLILVYLGEELALYVYANYYLNSALALLGILSVVILFTGASFISYPIIKWGPKFDKWAKNKSKFVKAFTYPPLIVICILPHITSIVLFYKNSNQYHLEQLDNFGVKQKVKITRKKDGKNSRHDLLFKYDHNGKSFDGMLHRWKYNVGDSALIIYSSENPGEVAWYYRYKENKK